MSDHDKSKTMLGLLFMVTVINFGAICYFTYSGWFTVSEFFLACMIWFYGTLIVVDHIWTDDEDDDTDDGGNDDDERYI